MLAHYDLIGSARHHGRSRHCGVRDEHPNVLELRAEVLNAGFRCRRVATRTVKNQIKLGLFNSVETLHEPLNIAIGDRDHIGRNPVTRLGPFCRVEY